MLSESDFSVYTSNDYLDNSQTINVLDWPYGCQFSQ